MDPVHEEEALGKAVDVAIMRRLWPFIAPYRLQVLATILLVVPLFALELVPAWVIKGGLDRALGEGEVDRPTRLPHAPHAGRRSGCHLRRGRHSSRSQDGVACYGSLANYARGA